MKLAIKPKLSEQPLLDALPNIRNIIKARVNNPDDIEDLVQETLARTLNNSEYTNIDNICAYTTTVAKSVVIDFWRAQNRVSFEELDETITDTQHTLEHQLTEQRKMRDVIRVVATMPRVRRKVFEQRRFNEVGRNQIASEMGITVGAVKKHMSRATQDLSLALHNLGW